MADTRIGTIYDDCGMEAICKYRKTSIDKLNFKELDPRDGILPDSACRIECCGSWSLATYAIKANVEVCDEEGYPIY